MPASLIVSAFALEGLAAAAVTLGAHLVTTIAVSYLINKFAGPEQVPQGSGQSGGKQSLNPATDNKLPVSYGDTWLAPIITDASISSDQQTMWFVLAFSETTDSGNITFDKVYWDDKLLLFDPANPHYIRGWLVPPGTEGGQATTVTGVGGKIAMWFYKDGSASGTSHVVIDGQGNESVAYTTQPAWEIFPGWDSSYKMLHTAFAIIQVKYDQNHGVTNLGQIKALVQNSLKKPGQVMKDYLGNDRYGCGVGADNIDNASFDSLDAWIDSGEIALTNKDNTKTPAFVRYEVNGYVDTTKDCLTNLADLASASDSWVQWNETKGKWGVLTNRSYTEAGLTLNDLTAVTADNIIGGINISPLDLNSTFNKFALQYTNNDYTYRGQIDHRYYELPAGSTNPNEPNNELSLILPFTSDSRQAMYIAYKRLFASREDLIINFTMDYSGIQIDAGDIIKISHEWYGWTNRLFRVTQVKEQKDGDGFLSVQITATSYNNAVYDDALGNPLHVYTQASFSNLGDPNIINNGYDSNGNPLPLDAPTFTQVNSTLSTYVVEGLVPINGRVSAMEFWYSVKGAELVNNQYVLYSTQFYGNGPLYPTLDSNGVRFKEQVQTSYLPPGTYYWRIRALGPNNATSEFSPPSFGLDWAPSGSPISGKSILDNSISGSKVISGDPPGTTPPSQNKGFFDTLGPIALASLGAAGAWYGYKKGIFDGLLPDDWKSGGGGNDGGDEEGTVKPKMWWQTTESNPQEGGSYRLVADATPDQPDPYNTATNEGMTRYGLPAWTPDDTNYGEG